MDCDMDLLFNPILTDTKQSSLVTTIIIGILIGLLIVSAISLFVIKMPFLNELVHLICAVVIVIFSFREYGVITWEEWFKYFAIRYFALVIYIDFNQLKVFETRYDRATDSFFEIQVDAAFWQKGIIALIIAAVVLFITDGVLPAMINDLWFSRYTYLGWLGIVLGLPHLFFVGRTIFMLIQGRKQ